MTESLLGMLHKTQRQVPAPLQIRIPADHPRVDGLVRLFKLLATGAQTQGGIIITGGGVSNEAERIFLNELELFLAEDGISLKSVIGPLLEQNESGLGLESLMQEIVGVTSKVPTLPRTLSVRPRSRS